MLSELLPEMSLPPIPVRGMCEDSRRVKSGDVFCAIKGEQVDGRQYIEAAIANGAVAVLAEAPLPKLDHVSTPLVAVPDLHSRIGTIASRFFGDPSHQLEVFAVTGTNGKTSFTQLLAQALGSDEVTCGIVGTMGFGLPGELKEPGLTTPSAVNMQRALGSLRDAGCSAVVLEASSHGLVQGRLEGVRVDTAVFTNITHDHLDYHESFEAYQQAKELLFHMPSVKRAVINIDDEFSRRLISRLGNKVTVTTYSLDKDATVSLVSKQADRAGVTVNVLVAGEMINAQLPLLGTFNIQNVLAVVASLVAIGWDSVKIQKGLAVLTTVTGRMDVLRSPGRPTVIVDYAHTPDALEKALVAVREHFPDSIVTCVFGCGGDRDRAKRPKMGEVASRLADRVILTSDNPRNELPASIIDEIEAGITAGDISRESDRRLAIRRAIKQASNDDVILVAGKGHEDYQELATGRIPFSDYEVIRDTQDSLEQVSVIVGLGDTGLSYVRYLTAAGKSFRILDDNPGTANASLLQSMAPGVEIEPLSNETLAGATDIFVSPGVPLRHPALVSARANGAVLHGDVKLFGELATAPIVAITGTNGKSTVTQLVYELFRDQGKRVAVAGNIGTPCLDVLADDIECYVLEVSSYQLEIANNLATQVAVVLNLAPDHLDRYDSAQDYYQAKLALYAQAKQPVINRGVDYAIPVDAAATFGQDQLTGEQHFGLVNKDGVSILVQGETPLLSARDLLVSGTHNLENVLAALAIGWLSGLRMQEMLATVRRFKGLPHRAESVGVIKGVSYINDSKATNPGAMVASVRGLATGRNIHLIAGGLAKGLHFDDLVDDLAPYVKSVYLIGAAQPQMMAELKGMGPIACDVLANAVGLASSNAVEGDVVLLSPGCASLDQFRNYIARGHAFRDLVEALVS